MRHESVFLEQLYGPRHSCCHRPVISCSSLLVGLMKGTRYRKPVIYDPSGADSRFWYLIRWSRRRLTPCSFLALVCLITLLVYVILRVKEQCRRALRWVDPPPLYGNYHAAELALPQHDAKTAFERGQKYLWVNNHVSGKHDIRQP